MTPQYIEITNYGTKIYHKDRGLSVIHREDGPAIEYSDGTKAWYRNSLLHREDGPAIEWADGGKRWYLEGVFYTEREFENLVRKGEVVLTLKDIAARFGVPAGQIRIVA
jgi:hypothetical protein